MNLNVTGSSNLAVGERVNGCLSLLWPWKTRGLFHCETRSHPDSFNVTFQCHSDPHFSLLHYINSSPLPLNQNFFFFVVAWNNPSIQTVVYPRWQFYHRSPVTFLMCGHLNAKCWKALKSESCLHVTAWVKRVSAGGAVPKCLWPSAGTVESLTFCRYGEARGSGCSSIQAVVRHNYRK